MNKIILGLFFVLFLGITNSFAQAIITVDGVDIDVAEFKRMYEKSSNNPDYSKKSVNDYLNTFTEYKLKLADAKAKGLHNSPEVLRELAIYEEQLIQNEFDREMMNSLLYEVQNRLNEEICARHLVLDVRKKATPDDTLFVYNKAMRLRNELVAGADFNQYVKKYSSDIDTKYSGGELGCFTALQLSSYNLENAVYDLSRGQYSMPIRSGKGYHIVQVTDRRASNGMVKATQLFARANETQSQELNFEAERKIRNAHHQLTQGANFNEVAKEFLTTESSDLKLSEDKIDWFTVGTYEADFEDAIFALQQPEQISQPIKTSLGWHIFRLDERKPLPNFSDIESNVRDAIMEDERYFNSKMKFGNKLKQQYDYEKNEENINSFVKEVANGIGIRGWQTPSMYNYSSTFFTIGDRVYTAQNFVDYVRDQHSLGRFYGFDYYYDTFESDKLLNHHRKNLINNNPSLQLMIDEYRDGILLSKYIEHQSGTKKETINNEEVKAFYQANRTNYRESGLVNIAKYAAPISDEKAVAKLKAFVNPQKADFFTRLALKKSAPEPVDVIQVPAEKATIEGINYAKRGAKGTRVHNNNFEYLVTIDIEQGDVLPYNIVSEQVLNDYLTAQKNKVNNTNSQEKYPYSVIVNKEVVQNLYR